MLEREQMVTRQIISRGVKDPLVIDAMKKVERHRLIPEGISGAAYEDSPLPIGMGQTISQPYIVALMTELLEPASTDKILEVGTGSGYQAAVLAEIVDKVYSIEIIDDLRQSAQIRLDALGYKNIFLKTADGGEGWPENAPYDGIVVTAAARVLPQELIKQLKEGGRMVIPLGSSFGIQELTIITRRADSYESQYSIAVRFVPMTGTSQSQDMF
ncbi:MAG: protein-L-isoaspartate(D-aspartate) O-methyltransferase [Lentisphaerae bacterium]|nr:protein-L-isoaspartate(D-aspartate) O-methyltransferase [Lentisphaerota bacterium]MCP4100121.1 protein-L-isoaspartate(D-aspartate) O-methyltransferase [Lentisphaerota bacterium]